MSLVITRIIEEQKNCSQNTKIKDYGHYYLWYRNKDKSTLQYSLRGPESGESLFALNRVTTMTKNP